ncbi:MAG: RnfABCDGE type electron transport complex subunit G [Clostridiales bacterium]|nr:RnfABCDGE type electron transport complex subunit G [Clostridiales bacterium]
MKTFKEFAVPTLILFLICAVAATLLALTNDVTAPKIQELASQTELAARKKVLADAEEFVQQDRITLDGKEYECFKGVKGDQTSGYVFTTVVKGYGGDIKVMTGVDAQGRVSGVEILEISETAGLGMNAKKPDFLNQFIGKTFEIFVSKDKPGENSVDALTGATISSRAVTSAVNNALRLYEAATNQVQLLNGQGGEQ